MSEDLSGDERDFLLWHKGFFGPGAREEIEQRVDQVTRELEGRHPNRAERLLVFSVLAERVKTERDNTLKDILRSRFNWALHEDGTMGTLGWNSYEVDNLASVSGLSKNTIRKWVKAIALETYTEAEAKFNVV